MLARRATTVALMVTMMLISACAGRAPEPAPSPSPVPVATQAPQPTAVVPASLPPEPAPALVTEQDKLRSELTAVAKRALNRDIQRIEVAQQREGLYTVAIAFVISGTITPSTSTSAVAAIRNKAEEEAASLLRAVLEDKPDLAVLELYGRATLENSSSRWQQDALRLSVSSSTAQILKWDNAQPAIALAGVDKWWWLDAFVDVGATSDRLYGDKNSAYTRPKS